MLDTRVSDLIKQGDALFSKRMTLMSYWQEVADHFYPERADFTVKRSLGDEFGTDLMTSVPVIARRDLGNLISAMLRPKETPWFDIHLQDERLDEEHEARLWMEWATGVQRRAMYDPVAQFVRSTKQTDHDWATFGNGVISVDVDYANMVLLYRNWHLRDCAWTENYSGAIDTMHQKWCPTVRQLQKLFPKTTGYLATKHKDNPDNEIKCRRIVLPRENYEFDKNRARGAQFVSVYVDEENGELLEEAPIAWFPYVVPRWSLVSGSQYGWSPATGPGLAEARSLQAVVRTLLEAGEKAVDPPMLATQDAIRSDIGLYAGGVTWVDIEYDERLGEALRQVQQVGNIPAGIEFADRLERVIQSGMFLNTLMLPQDYGKMTAYEVRKRVEQHIRASAPIFEPAESDYNAPLCERTFEVLQRVNAFGPPDSLPRSLQGQDIRFTFTSPLIEMAKEVKAQQFLEGSQLLVVAREIDPAQVSQVKITTAFREALKGAGWDEDWLNPEEDVDAARQAQAEQANAMRGAEMIAGGVQVAKTAADATKVFAEAGVA